MGLTARWQESATDGPCLPQVWGNADRDLDPIIKVTCKACLEEWDAQFNGHL